MTNHSLPVKSLPVFLAAATLATTLVCQSQTVIFNDTFENGSTLNGTSTPGGTPSASSTSYDVASTKTGSCTIGANLLREKLSSATTAGYVELQAIFTGTPVQLVSVGDSINLTLSFTNSAGTLLAGGAGSVIDVGLFNSDGNLPLAGSLNSAGLGSATTYITGNCQAWQGYVAAINYSGAASSVYTRPVQNGASPNNGVQDLLFSNAGTGLYKFPAGTPVGSSLTSAVTLASGAKYTLSFTVLLSAPQTITLINNLVDSTGTLISAQTNTTAGGNTYTNAANLYDGFAIGINNKGTSHNPQMDISQITISTNFYFAPTIAGLTNQTVIAGNSLTLSPTIAGNPAPSFQWQTNGVDINGATSSALALDNVGAFQDGYVYSLVASNSIGSVTNSMVLSVIEAPGIAALANQAVYVGGTANISATVGGVPAPVLQWQRDGIDLADGATGNGSTISGSTSSTLSIASAQADDTGAYSLIASNSAGMVTNSMYLLVSASDVAPTLVGPDGITVILGSAGTFTASAYYGLPQPALQWLDETGTPIPDATNASLTISNVQYSQNNYVYSLVAGNSVGSVTNTAVLTVIVPPVITSQPVDLTVTNTQAASFTVAATGEPEPAYQWYRNGSLISSAANHSATNATLVLPSATSADAGSSYYVRIANAAGTTNSASAVLSVNSTMTVAALSPANGATGLCYDTPLTVTFSSVPGLGASGAIKIYNTTNSTTPVDTINAADGLVQPRIFPGDGQSFSFKTIVINGSSVTIYPHPNGLASNQTYYVTIDNGTFTDAAGANFVGITATNVWQFTTKPGGPGDPDNVVVNPNGSGDYLTVQGAVNDIPAGNTTPRIIHIRDGIYTEIVDIAGRHNVTFRGQSRLGTLVGYANNANLQIANGGTTHARMAFKVNANDIGIENLTITNMTPQGGSQAEALMIESSARRCIVNNATIVSRQDTILANVNSSQAYFYNSTVRGNFDYLWGGGNLYFDQCEIRTVSGASGFNVTAARTDTSPTTSASFPWANPGGAYTANGMSFVNCRFTAESGVGPVTLAGSNGTAGNNVSWYGCDFATNYLAPSASLFSGNFVFWQDANTMDSSPVTFAVVTSISGTDARLLAATNIPTWFYGWTPQLAPNILTNPVDQNVIVGSPATFTVTATGVPAPTYQWLKHGTNIMDETNALLTISSTDMNDAGDYSVVVTTPAGNVTSSPAKLTVNPTPPAPTVTAPTVTGGQLSLTINGQSGPNYSVQVSTNLAGGNWVTIFTTNAPALPLTFTDTNPLLPVQFYRVLAGP